MNDMQLPDPRPPVPYCLTTVTGDAIVSAVETVRRKLPPCTCTSSSNRKLTVAAEPNPNVSRYLRLDPLGFDSPCDRAPVVARSVAALVGGVAELNTIAGG